jgi:hypothetical protein
MKSPLYQLTHQLRLWLPLGCLTAIALMSGGCSSTTTATKSGFLPDYQKMHAGQYVQNYWAAPAISKQKISKIYVAPVDISRIDVQEGLSPAEASQFLRTTTLYHIRTLTSLGAEEKPDNATAALALAITYLTPGSSSARAWAAELGAGHAYVQVEGKLLDAASKEQLACFSERRHDSGSIGFEDMGGDAGTRLERRMLEAISREFVKELSASAK